MKEGKIGCREVVSAAVNGANVVLADETQGKKWLALTGVITSHPEFRLPEPFLTIALPLQAHFGINTCGCG